MSQLGKARLFVVDDEPAIALSVAAVLRYGGYDSTAFVDPLQALAAAQTDLPDLLLSDVHMPGMSGVELCIRFKLLAPGCPILLFSGHAYTDDLLKPVRDAGFDIPIIAKPIHPTELISRIKAMLSPQTVLGGAC